MTFRPVILSTLLFALSSATTVLAHSSSRYTLSGFGTLGYAALDDSAFVYRSSRGGRGTGDGGSFALDSRFGLQLDAEFTPTLSTTLQGVVREGVDGDADAMVEWAFARWIVNDSLTVRAGRMTLPTFALSDYRDVGYAHTRARPPEDVYAQVPISRYDGVDLSINGEFGETLWGLQIGAGLSKEKLRDEIRVDADVYIVNLTAERGPVQVRLGRLAAWSDVRSPDLDALSGALQQASAFVPALAPLAEEFAEESIRTYFDGVGLRFDAERFFVDAEYAWRTFDFAAYNRGDVHGWSLLLGTHIGSLTPYAIASAYEDSIESPDIELPPVPQLAPLAFAIDAAYQNRSQSTLGLGVRWDFAPDLAFKVQAERVSSESKGISIGRNDAPATLTEVDDVTLYAITLDFVF